MNYLTLVNQFIGKHYTKTVLVRLATKNIVNPRGKQYCNDYIKKVVKGTATNNEIEAEILALIKISKRKKNKQQLMISTLQDAANLIKTI